MEYEVATTAEFDAWLASQESAVRETIGIRIMRLRSGLFGDHKAVGDKVSELRFHGGAGHRIYYTVQGRVLVILLCGGTKGTQRRDINRAKTMAAEL